RDAIDGGRGGVGDEAGDDVGGGDGVGRGADNRLGRIEVCVQVADGTDRWTRDSRLVIGDRYRSDERGETGVRHKIRVVQHVARGRERSLGDAFRNRQTRGRVSRGRI